MVTVDAVAVAVTKTTEQLVVGLSVKVLDLGLEVKEEPDAAEKVPRVGLNERVVGTCLFTNPWTVTVVVTVEVLQGTRTVIVLVQLR